MPKSSDFMNFSRIVCTFVLKKEEWMAELYLLEFFYIQKYYNEMPELLRVNVIKNDCIKKIHYFDLMTFSYLFSFFKEQKIEKMFYTRYINECIDFILKKEKRKVLSIETFKKSCDFRSVLESIDINYLFGIFNFMPLDRRNGF
ncbi:hypothetical protein NGRA_1862 [Nosema granulosis]|uniref:Uncharacterized protein n=1 Tax=Nosema granulosis TaxID=83296 RepID=A0A9P6KYQ0_9MICR|nr:hypothetical protein NGRA_1862 [Nosema granulosis]